MKRAQIVILLLPCSSSRRSQRGQFARRIYYYFDFVNITTARSLRLMLAGSAGGAPAECKAGLPYIPPGRLARANGNDAYDYRKGAGHASQGGVSASSLVRKSSLISYPLAAPSCGQPNRWRRSMDLSAVSGAPGRGVSQPRRSRRLLRKGGQTPLRITANTSILVRAGVGDDPDHRGTEVVAVTRRGCHRRYIVPR